MIHCLIVPYPLQISSILKRNRVFEPKDYANITSFTFFPALIAPAIAPALGGTIIHFLKWQWIFILTASFCSITVILSIIFLKSSELTKSSFFDWLGFLFAVMILILGLHTLSDFGKNGLSYFSSANILAITTLIYLFIKRETKFSYPLIHLDLFKNKMFVESNLIQIVFQICHYGSFFTIGIFLQVGVGMSALVSGIVIGMQAIGAMVTNRVSVKLFYLYGPGVTLMIGFSGLLFVTACLLKITKPDDYYYASIIMFSRGLCSGLCGTPIQLTSFLGFNRKQISQASAVYNAGRQVAITLGIALASFMIAYGIKLHPGMTNAGLMHRQVFLGAFYLIFVSALIGIFLSYLVDNKLALKLAAK